MAWQTVVPDRARVVMWGAGDQARVNQPILERLGCEIVVLVDDTPGLQSPFPGVALEYGWNGFQRWLDDHGPSELGFVVAIGNPYGHVRRSLHERLVVAGLAPVSFADPTALVSSTAKFAEGLQAMPHALLHHHATVGEQCILNTKSLVEHDCVLGPGVEIGPGAVLCGRVHVGANTWIGAGATVRPRVTIGANSIVGAGAVVVSDIPDGVIAVGVPARPMAEAATASARYSAGSQG